MAGVTGKEGFGLRIPAIVLGQQDGEPAHVAALVPLPVRGNDGMGDYAAVDGLLGGGHIVRDCFVVSAEVEATIAGLLVAGDPTVPATADAIPVPFAVGVVGRNRLALVVEGLVISDVLGVL